MFLRHLLEIFDTRSITKIQYEGNDEFISFNGPDNTVFCVNFEWIDLTNKKLEKDLEEFKSKSCACIMFGDITSDGVINTKVTAKNKGAFPIFGSVRNIILDWVNKNDPNIIIFAAKNNDASFDSRASLYSTIAKSSAKQFGFSFFECQDNKGHYFVMSKEAFTKKHINALKNEIIPNSTFGEKLKTLIGKYKKQ